MNTKLFLSVIVAGITPQLFALSVPPNTAPTALSSGGPVGGTQIAQILNQPFSGIDIFNNVRFTGDLTSTAYDIGTGVAFVYDLDITTADTATHRLTVTGYGGFNITDAYYLSGTGNVTPATVERSADGTVLGFNFEASAGQSPDDLVVITDANTDVFASASVIDGATANVLSLGPKNVTTTPDGGATAMLLGMGFLGAAGVRRKLS